MLSITTTNRKIFLSEKGLIMAEFNKEAMTFNASFEDGRDVSIENVKGVHRRRFPTTRTKSK